MAYPHISVHSVLCQCGTQAHAHTHILEPFEDSEPTGLKVDNAKPYPLGQTDSPDGGLGRHEVDGTSLLQHKAGDEGVEGEGGDAGAEEHGQSAVHGVGGSEDVVAVASDAGAEPVAGSWANSEDETYGPRGCDDDPHNLRQVGKRVCTLRCLYVYIYI